MLNSVSANNYVRNSGFLTAPITKTSQTNIMGDSTGILPLKKESVTIDGETYNVKKVPDTMACDKYKEVVVIDGKQYDVKEVPDRMWCDKTKKVVVVDGEQYDVKDSNSILPLFA